MFWICLRMARICWWQAAFLPKRKHHFGLCQCSVDLLADWVICWAMLPLGRPTHSKLYTPRAPSYIGLRAMAQSRESLRPYLVGQIGLVGPRMEAGCALMSGIAIQTIFRCGKCQPMELTFIPCFLVGTIRRQSVV